MEAYQIKAKCVAVFGLLAGFFWGLDPLIRTLVVLIVLDILTGLAVGYIRQEIHSDASRKGMVKKALILVLVGAAHTFNATQPLGFDAASGVAGFFALTELISIIENCANVGVPIPPALTRALSSITKGTEKQ